MGGRGHSLHSGPSRSLISLQLCFGALHHQPGLMAPRSVLWPRPFSLMPNSCIWPVTDQFLLDLLQAPQIQQTPYWIHYHPPETFSSSFSCLVLTNHTAKSGILHQSFLPHAHTESQGVTEFFLQWILLHHHCPSWSLINFHLNHCNHFLTDLSVSFCLHTSNRMNFLKHNFDNTAALLKSVQRPPNTLAWNPNSWARYSVYEALLDLIPALLPSLGAPSSLSPLLQVAVLSLTTFFQIPGVPSECPPTTVLCLGSLMDGWSLSSAVPF